MRLSHLLMLLLLNCGWAAVPTIATRAARELSASEFVFLRYAFALAAFVAVWRWLPGHLPRGADFWRTVVMGVAVFNIGHLLQVAGIQLSKASDASIMLALDPLVSSLGAALFLHERIPGRRWLGFVAAIAGVAILSLWGRDAPFPSLMANLLIVLSFVSEAVWSVMGKPMISRWGIPKVAGLAILAGTVANALMLAPNAVTHWNAFQKVSLEGWVSLAILGIVLTSFGYCAWYIVIREAPVSVAAMTVYLQPVVGTSLAVAWMGERLHAGHFLGSAAILCGLIVGISDRSALMITAVPEK